MPKKEILKGCIRNNFKYSFILFARAAYLTEFSMIFNVRNERMTKRTHTHSKYRMFFYFFMRGERQVVPFIIEKKKR